MARAWVATLALVSSFLFVAAGACHSSSTAASDESGDAFGGSGDETAGESDAESDCAVFPEFPQHCACRTLADYCAFDAGPCGTDFDTAFASLCGPESIGYGKSTAVCDGYSALMEHGVDTATFYFYDSEAGALRGGLYMMNVRTTLCFGDVPSSTCLDSWKFVYGCDAGDAD